MKDTRWVIQSVIILEWATPPVIRMASTSPRTTVASAPTCLAMLWAMAS